MPLRKFIITLVTTAIVLLSVPAWADSGKPWSFDGGGWGHGVGLSQYGAKGQAEDGRLAADILKFYYSEDAFVGALPAEHWTNDPEGLKIGLVSDTTWLNLGAMGAGDVTICQPSIDCSQVNEILTTSDTWFFEVNLAPEDPEADPVCRVRRGVGQDGENWGWGECNATVSQPTGTATRISAAGTEYPHGTLYLTESTNGFHAVLRLPLEEYLLGLSEMPSSWSEEALRAQAIIGRSFAVATAEARNGSPFWEDLCGCQLRDTSSDQVYSGWTKEDPANGGNNWKAAVEETSGDILKHPASWLPLQIVETFYSSSNGGASENNEDVWGGTPRPWLRSVADPWSADPSVNPLANWTVNVAHGDLETSFGWDRVIDAIILEGPPGVQVRFTGIDGGSDVEKVLNGTEIRSILNSSGFKEGGGTVRVSPYITAVTPGFTDPPGFDDIDGHLFEGDIQWAAQRGITQGCNPPLNTLFCPDDGVSREVMAAFMSRALNLPPASKDYFGDDNNSIFEDDINRMAEARITTGCGGTKFCPKTVVDRGQMAAFLVRALGLKDDGGGNLFIDDNHSIFENDIDRLATAGITRGCNPPTNNRYCPNLAVDRGAMAAFLHRALGP